MSAQCGTGPCFLMRGQGEGVRGLIVGPAAEVLVRTDISAIGRTSVSFEQEVVAPDGGVAATSRSVLVAWDEARREARAITDDERAKLA